MRFEPSKYSDLGWTEPYTANVLTRSGTAAKYGISNVPTASANANLSRISDFLAKLPWSVNVTSGYRNEEVNAKAGGVAGSAHTTGSAVDFTVDGMTNKEIATWFYENQSRYPELDKVIWYQDSGHVHVQISSSGRKLFYTGFKEGHDYYAWTPGTLSVEASIVAPLQHLSLFSRIMIGMALTGIAVTGVVYADRKLHLFDWTLR